MNTLILWAVYAIVYPKKNGEFIGYGRHKRISNYFNTQNEAEKYAKQFYRLERKPFSACAWKRIETPISEINICVQCTHLTR